MATRAYFHMRCQNIGHVAPMQQRYRAFSSEVFQRFKETLAWWRDRDAKDGDELDNSEVWHIPADLVADPPFLSVQDRDMTRVVTSDYAIATVTPADVDRLARDLDTEVVFVSFSRISDNFQFTRSLAGVLQRHLFNKGQFYKGEAGWKEVLGTPESWEGRAFPLGRLDEVERFYAANEDLADEWAYVGPALNRVREARRVPAVGLPDTFLRDVWEAADVVGEHYGLPNWRIPRFWR